MKCEFGHLAEDYARYRPPYPGAVFQIIEEATGPPNGRWAADVGAGTGIFSSRLAACGWRVVAVEPSAPMLHRIRPVCESDAVVALSASAEATGLTDASVSLVAAAQAFHWFNPPLALAEFARILAPHGILAILWNNRDASRSAFVEEFESLVGRYNTKYRREYRQQDWAAKIATADVYDAARHHRVDHLWRLSADAFVGFTRSVSYIQNVLPAEQRKPFEADLRSVMARHFGESDCEIPLRTDLWIARKRAS